MTVAGKILRMLRRIEGSALTTSRMADILKEMLTRTGTVKLMIGRKNFLSNIESRTV